MPRADTVHSAAHIQQMALWVLLLSLRAFALTGTSWIADEYVCLDRQWLESCVIGFGSFFSGENYRRSASELPCVDGTTCAYNARSETVRCQISGNNQPLYEECRIPNCSRLPLCNASLELLDNTIFLNGVATVSTSEQVVAALRNHDVTEIVLTHDLAFSDYDLDGFPIIFKPGRELVINKQGTAKLYITHHGAVPTIIVFSGSNVESHRWVFNGDPFDQATFGYEGNANMSIHNTLVVFDSCAMVSAFSHTLQSTQSFVATGTHMTGSVHDDTLRLFMNTTGWIQGHSVMYRDDPDWEFSGSMRFIDTELNCDHSISQPLPYGTDVYSPPPHIAAPANPGSSDPSTSLVFVVAGLCSVLLVLVPSCAAYQCFMYFRRSTRPLTPAASGEDHFYPMQSFKF